MNLSQGIAVLLNGLQFCCFLALVFSLLLLWFGWSFARSIPAPDVVKGMAEPVVIASPSEESSVLRSSTAVTSSVMRANTDWAREWKAAASPQPFLRRSRITKEHGEIYDFSRLRSKRCTASKKAHNPAPPISALPVEMLSYILEHAELSYRSDFDRLADVPATCALAFCLVSKFWYAVALKTPILWTRHTLVDEFDGCRSAQWMKRTQKQMLDLSIQLSWFGCYKHSEVHTLLEPYDGRLERLSLRFPLSDNPRWRVSPAFSSVRFLRLEEVTFDYPMICEILLSAPRLETLVAHATHCHRTSPPSEEESALEPTRLLDFELHTDCLDIITEIQLCRLLQASPDLEFLSLSFPSVFGMGVPAPTLPPVVLPRLKAASLPVARFSEVIMTHWSVSPQCYTSFGHRLACGPLHEISDSRRPVYFDKIYVLDFESDRRSMALARITQYLNWTQSIEELIIKNSDQNLDRLLDFILRPNLVLGEWALPHLRIVRVENCPGWKYDLTQFSRRYPKNMLYDCPEVLTSNFVYPRPLEGVYIYNCPSFENVEDARDMFRTLGTSFHFGRGSDGDDEVRSEAEEYERELTTTIFPFDRWCKYDCVSFSSYLTMLKKRCG